MFEVHSSPQLKVLLKEQGRSDHFGKWPVHFTCEKASRTKSGSVALTSICEQLPPDGGEERGGAPGHQALALPPGLMGAAHTHTPPSPRFPLRFTEGRS